MSDEPRAWGADPLAGLPALGDPQAQEAWVRRALLEAPSEAPSEGWRATATELGAARPVWRWGAGGALRGGGGGLSRPVGEGAGRMARMALGLLWADWACYGAPVDRVEAARLGRVLGAFPRGFRLWWVCGEGERWRPAGYTGWYPISGETFGRLEGAPQTLTDRGQAAPLLPGERDEGWVYVFNYSALPWARGVG